LGPKKEDLLMTENSKILPVTTDAWRTELEELQRNYRLKTVELQMEDRRLELVKVANMDELLDRITDVDELPFWAEIWPAAIGLAVFILRNQTFFNGKRVLELGAGAGLAGIAAKLAGAQVTQSDFIKAAFPFIGVNCLRNQVPVGNFLLADWRNFPEVPELYDFIIGADILYEKTVHPDLEKVFHQALKPRGRVYLGDPGRGFGRQFVTGLTTAGWENIEVQIPVFYEEQNYTIDIYQLTPPGNRAEDVSL
jgi:predicted nicotinamide N-methyase